MAKQIDVSDDSGGSWFTLPGNQGALNFNGEAIEDTVFGQTFQSNITGLIEWNIEANALYKGFAGYQAKLKKAGTSTAFTGEAMSLVSGKIYQINDAAKEVWDRDENAGANPFVIYDNAVDHTADVEWIDHLFGRIKFLDAYTVTGAVTADGAYFPTAVLGTANSFTLTQTADAIETTDFDTAQTNNGHKTHQPGLRNVSLELSGFFNLTNDFYTELVNRNELIIEINPDGSANSLCRGFFRAVTEAESGDVGALEEESTTFELSVPTGDALGDSPFRPFGWQHETASTIPEAIKKCITAWENEATDFQARYLRDGTNGRSGVVIVTDFSLSSGLDAMNEFSVNLMGSGETTAVGTG